MNIFHRLKKTSFSSKETAYLKYDNKGKYLLHLKQYNKAVKYYNKAIQLNATEPDVFNSKAVALQQLNRNVEAIIFFDKAIDLDPDYEKAYFNKARLLSSLSSHQQAIRLYDKAIKIKSNENTVYYAYLNKANEMRKLNESTDKILACLESAIQLKSNYPAAYLNKGSILSESNKHRQAIECFNKSIEFGMVDSRSENLKQCIF